MTYRLRKRDVTGDNDVEPSTQPGNGFFPNDDVVSRKPNMPPSVVKSKVMVIGEKEGCSALSFNTILSLSLAV